MELNSVKEMAVDVNVDVDVLVVGAGPTGLALGADLARRGVDALVVERADALFPGSRGKGLQPRTMEVFDDLGVLDAIRAAGGDYPVGMIWQDGERVGEHQMFEPAEPTDDSPYNAPWMVPQWRTQEILFARLEELGGRVAFGREVVAVTQDGDGDGDGVTVEFASGAPVRARYVVAADGGRSAVRRALGIGMTGETVDPDSMLVADVRISGLDRDNWHVFPPREDTGGFLAICPLAGTEDFQVVAQFPEGADVDLSLDGIRRTVAARSHLSPEAVTEVRWASDFRPRAALADRFRAGRVFLAGDAAHIHSPAGGQGLNTSVRTPTTWAGSSARYCAARLTSPCSTPTRRNGSPSPPTCSACPPGSTAARSAAAGRPASSGSATATPRSRWRPVRTCRTSPCTRATALPTEPWTAYASSTRSGDRTGRCSRSARTRKHRCSPASAPCGSGRARGTGPGSSSSAPTATWDGRAPAHGICRSTRPGRV